MNWIGISNLQESAIVDFRPVEGIVGRLKLLSCHLHDQTPSSWTVAVFHIIRDIAQYCIVILVQITTPPRLSVSSGGDDLKEIPQIKPASLYPIS